MDAEKQQKVEVLKAKMRGRLEGAAPEDFRKVRKLCLDYVHENNWPQEEITDVQVIILDVQAEREDELPGRQEERRDDGRRVDDFMQMFADWDSAPEWLRQECQKHYTIGRQEVPSR